MAYVGELADRVASHDYYVAFFPLCSRTRRVQLTRRVETCSSIEMGGKSLGTSSIVVDLQRFEGQTPIRFPPGPRNRVESPLDRPSLSSPPILGIGIIPTLRVYSAESRVENMTLARYKASDLYFGAIRKIQLPI